MTELFATDAWLALLEIVIPGIVVTVIGIVEERR